MSDAEGPVWHAASPDNWVRPELAAAAWVGLGRAGAITRNDAVNAQRYLGRTLWRRWSGYHRRSRVETKMHCIKLLGQSLMARDFERQVAEIQSASPSSIATRLLVYLSQNLSARCAWGKGRNVLHPVCATKPYLPIDFIHNRIGANTNTLNFYLYSFAIKQPTWWVFSVTNARGCAHSYQITR